jgi:hypothetical protein
VALTAADYDLFPRFHYAEQTLSELNTRLLHALIGLLIPIAALAWFSMRRVRRYPVTG